MSMRTTYAIVDLTAQDVVTYGTDTPKVLFGAVGETQNTLTGTTPAVALQYLDQWNQWIYVYNGTVANWAVGEILARSNGSAGYSLIPAPTSSPSIRVVGVAQHAINASRGGWILREGIGYVRSIAGYTQDFSLVVSGADAGHAVDRAAVTDHAFALAFETVAAAPAGAVGICRIKCEG